MTCNEWKIGKETNDVEYVTLKENSESRTQANVPNGAIGRLNGEGGDGGRSKVVMEAPKLSKGNIQTYLNELKEWQIRARVEKSKQALIV